MKRNCAYIKLFAGLGNQLFQYSYGQYLKDAGQAVRYLLAPSRNCLTDVFDVPAGDIFSTSNSLWMIAMKVYAKYVARRWFVDFFADSKYASHGKAKLRFRRAVDYAEDRVFGSITSVNSVAIHVRGGDYLTESGFPGWGSVCDKEYYAKAIARIESIVDDPVYFIFSNDYDHARRVVPESPSGKMVFVDVEDFKEDAGFHLFLMSSCKHNIIANSTYSWWGAFLGMKDGRIVVAPGRWEKFNTPLEWIRV